MRDFGVIGGVIRHRAGFIFLVLFACHLLPLLRDEIGTERLGGGKPRAGLTERL